MSWVNFNHGMELMDLAERVQDSVYDTITPTELGEFILALVTNFDEPEWLAKRLINDLVEVVEGDGD